MPYDPNTGIPEGLLHILDLSIGRRAASILLHDYLEHPNSKATRLELVRASRAAINLEREIDNGSMKSRVIFQTKIGEQTWCGDEIAVPTLPAVMALGVIGRPLNSVIGHSQLPSAPIRDVATEGCQKLLIERRDIPMKTIRPGWLSRLLSGWRTFNREAKLARSLYAHQGHRPLPVLVSIVTGCIVYAFMTIAAILALPEHDGYGPLPDAIGILTGLIAAVSVARHFASKTRRQDAIYIWTSTMEQDIVSRGHAGESLSPS